MLFRWARLTVCLTLLISSFALMFTSAQDAKASDASIEAAVIPVNQTIESGLHSFMERAFAKAESSGAKVIILEINTFGGRVDSAVEIGELIRNSKLETVAYVKGKAISAGSYIALNTDRIFMQQGSSIGDAAVVTVGGQRVTDSKIVSMWVRQMRSAAEATERNADYAEGMADDTRSIEIPELGITKAPGQLITFTAQEAVKTGYAEEVVSSIDDVMNRLGITSYERIEQTPAENLARVLTNPIVMTLLFIIGLAGVLIELFVPGFGVPGIIGICSFALYFLGNYVAGFAEVEHLALFIAGVVLLLLELFLPSFGILGILGILSVIGGVVMAAYDTGNALLALGIAFLVAGVVVAVVVRYFKHKGIWNRFILKEELTTDEGFVSHSSKEELIGKRGQAVTPLRPAGTAMIGDERIDVVTNGNWIASGATVEVIKIEGIRVVVKEVSEIKKP